MKTARSRSWWSRGLASAVAVTIVAAQAGEAQTTRMPSTLRYGSGYLDVPVASVLPHLAVTGTFSGFRIDLDNTVAVDPVSGGIIGTGPERREWMFDGSVALGLFHRLEIGTTLQSFGGADTGGDMWGAFGRLAVLRPQEGGIGLAGGIRYVTAPSYQNGVRYQPPRLGFPDRSFRKDRFDAPDTDDDIQTELTFYVVASAMLRGLESDWLPTYDATISAGWGQGMFNGGERLEFYRSVHSEGWFVGGAAHVEVGSGSLLNVIGEWNGFDLNLGAQLDLSGVRIGGHILGANYRTQVSEYRSRKYGFLVSACLDLSRGGSFRCRPSLMARRGSPRPRLAPPEDL